MILLFELQTKSSNCLHYLQIKRLSIKFLTQDIICCYVISTLYLNGANNMANLNERSKKILWAIIHGYIDSNEPVGSCLVSERYFFGLSPATIRNIMAELKELGYITQPHTSAGRIPTEKGYRLYVNSLLKERAFSIEDKPFSQQLSNRLHSIEKDLKRLIEEASRALSRFSHYLSVATSQRSEDTKLKRMEFIRDRGNNVLCILISEDGMVKNKIIAVDEMLTQRDLDRITKYLNSELTGLSLKEIKTKIISQMSIEKTICDKLISNAFRMCRKAIMWAAADGFIGEISGNCNLPDFATLPQIKKIFHAIEDKHLIVRLLDKIYDSQGVQVFIGSENILPEMKDFSLVFSTYNGRDACGTIGIIGPTRMNYKSVIPIVDHTAKTLTQILSGR